MGTQGCPYSDSVPLYPQSLPLACSTQRNMASCDVTTEVSAPPLTTVELGSYLKAS